MIRSGLQMWRLAADLDWVSTTALAAVLLLVLPASTAQSQATPDELPSYVRTQWTAEDGLPVNSILDVVQTDDGYLWLATYDGLVRFDGLDFKVYRSADYEGLPSNRILRLLVRGRSIWMRTEARHLVRFERDTFATVASDVRTVHSSPSGPLWIGTEDGLAVYRDGAVQRVADDRIEGKVQSIWAQPDGTLWVGMVGAGMYRRAPNGRVTPLTGRDGLAGMTVGAFAAAEDGIWIGSWGGLQRWVNGQFQSVPIDGSSRETLSVFSLDSGTAGATWVFSDSGVYRWNGRALVPTVGQHRSYHAASRPNGGFVKKGPNGRTWIAAGQTLYRNGVPVFRTERVINRFTFDRQGTLWVGTATEGLFRFRPSLFSVYGEAEGLATDNVYPIEQGPEGSIWLGTLDGGLTRIDDGGTTTFRPTKNGQVLRSVWALHEDRSGRLWVGGTRLCVFDSGQCVRPFSDGPIVGTRIHAIYEDQRGRLWVGTVDQGLYRCDGNCTHGDGSWRQFTPENSALPHSYVRTIHETPQGTLWVGMNGGGIARYRNGSFLPVSEEDGLSSNLIRDVYQDTTGILWVATEDQGLNRVVLDDSDTRPVSSVTAYQKEDGLFDNALHQILADDQGRFWFSTNRGIFWVEKANLEAFARGDTDEIHSVSYTTGEGMPSREANGGMQPAGLRASDGRFWFPTQGGAAVIDPSSVHRNESPPPLRIERVRSGKKVVARRPRTDVQLTPTQRTFSIEYTGIHLTDPRSVTFRYRLDGLQDEWQPVGKRRNAFFTSVPPGTYTFEVQARRRGGPWNATPAELAISVTPHFYETWWFYAVAALCIGLSAAGLLRFWMYRQRRRSEVLEEEVRERTEELAMAKKEAEAAFETVAEQAEELRELDQMKSRLFVNVSHELRTPLSLMLGPIERIVDDDLDPSEQEEMLEVLQRNARRLQRLVQQILNLARYDAGRLDRTLSTETWGGFVEQCVQRLTPLAEAQEVTLSVDTDGAGVPVALDPDHMETVVANLVRNGLTYTPAGGRVEVRAGVESEEVILVVEDTGPGIPIDEQSRLFDRFYRGAEQSDHGGTGLGLALTRALVNLHDGTIDVDSRVGEGSRFVVQWPRFPERSGDVAVPGEPSSEGSAWDPEAVLFHGDGGRPVDTPPDSTTAFASDDAMRSVGDRTTILVVDDNGDVRRLIRRLLEPKYRLLEAENGKHGLQRARAALPDLVIADVMMPGVDGFAMVEALRERPRTECIPIIMLTARAEERDQIEGLDEGADAYVTKPFDADVLRAQINRLIQSRRTLRNRLAEAAEGEGRRSRERASSKATVENTFEERVRSTISRHLADSDFSVQMLADEVGVTRRTATRKVKEAFGQTPSKLIRTARLERGAQLLDEEAGTVSEVAYAVGFSSLSYFSRSFKLHFGVSPSAYADQG